MFIAMNRFRVARGSETEFEQVWLSRDVHLRTVAGFEALRDKASFRRSMTLMTLVWGFGLIGEAALAGALVCALSVRQYLLVAPVIGNGAVGALALWTFWYSRRQRRRRVGHGARIEAASPAVSAA